MCSQQTFPINGLKLSSTISLTAIAHETSPSSGGRGQLITTSKSQVFWNHGGSSSRSKHPPWPSTLPSVPHRIAFTADVIEVDSESQITDWTGTCTAAFGFDDNLSNWWHDLHASLPFGDSAPLRHFLVSIDGESVGTASAFVTDDVVGLASVGVKEELRRQGIGSALTLAALDPARKLGCRLAVLFSSAMATSMYEALGFRRYTRTRLPVTLVYQGELPNQSMALKRELAIKSLSRKAKEALIQSGVKHGR